MPWDDIPHVKGFKTGSPGGRGQRRHPSVADKEEEERHYAKHLCWAQRCGLAPEDFDFKSELVGAGALSKRERGLQGIPLILQRPIGKCEIGHWE